MVVDRDLNVTRGTVDGTIVARINSNLGVATVEDLGLMLAALQVCCVVASECNVLFAEGAVESRAL